MPARGFGKRETGNDPSNSKVRKKVGIARSTKVVEELAATLQGKGLIKQLTLIEPCLES